MQCFIYKSLKKEELYLYLQKKDDFSEVPEPLFNSLGRIEFVMARSYRVLGNTEAARQALERWIAINPYNMNQITIWRFNYDTLKSWIL